MPKPFNGVINVDVRDSVADWGPYLAETAPEGAPNVLIVLYDDTGLAAWSPYGGRIEMPTMDRLAANGVTYSQWHTTALCSPTRSCFLTGRNHHQNGFAQIAEGAQGFPGHTGHIPMENAALAEVLREKGWNTFWLGKNHNVPVDEWAMGGTKRNWPLARGFDRFYGFIGGETNQWYPTLAEDNHYVEQPYGPEEGYHLSKDLADKAMSFIRDSKQSNPEKPWFLWFCPGANHAPHHAPQEFIDKYKGNFDDGYEACREWMLPRMIERGILPDDTELTPINPLPDGKVMEGDLVRPWDTLSDDEKALFSRMAEVYAGFSEYTDHQVGRIEAGKYDVLPLDDRTVAELVAVQPTALIPPSGTWEYYLGTIEVPEFAAANTRGRSYKILADVELSDGDAEGVLFAQGARFGGHSLFVKDRKLWYVYNFIGIPPEQQLVSEQPLEAGEHVLGMEFVKESVGERHETHGTARLYVDDKVVAEGAWRTQPGHFALCGEGLSVGRDSSDPVSKEYTGSFPLTGGTIRKVEVNVADDVYLDAEREFAAAMARD